MFGRFIKKAQAQDKLPSYMPDPSRILYVCSFDDSICGWNDRGPADESMKVKLSVDTEIKHSGTGCLKITGRSESWHGASLNIAKYIREGLRDYEVMVWVKVPDGAPSCKVQLSLETNSMLGGVVFPYYEQFGDFDPESSILSKYRLPVNGGHGKHEAWEIAYPQGHVTADGWVLLHGKVKINRAEHFRAFVYLETNAQGKDNDIYVDDFVLLKGS
ncbi:MAG: carbohydrate binding domain-containing protein [Oscillospiraceae bacterium]|nr:carbohydrate binding domain-containing protein [Oscillospiraceae bacterium]